jgi:ABC-2 type transport system ATP-binding protein
MPESRSPWGRRYVFWVEPAILADDLVRQFKAVKAVNGIDIEVAPGEIYGFLGPNGAGKSTTVHMLTTLLPPTSGRAVVGGYDVLREGPKVRKTIGAALQEAALDPFLTGRDHMRLQGALHGLSRQERKERGQELLDRVGLADAADRKVRTYSGGMKRRLDLALALMHRPKILFLDEPTTGLDPSSRNALWVEVARLARQDGVTIFLTTQYLEEADVLADRVAIIDLGRIVAEGSPESLKAEIGRPTVEAVPADPDEIHVVAEVLARFGTPVSAAPKAVAVRLEGDADLADVVRALDAEGVRHEHLRLHAPSLDDVFLAKTGHRLEGEEGEETEQPQPVPA